MTKEQLAERLNGREYRNEITESESIEARESGLVVVFGYSDDNAEFRGAFTDEIGCYGGADIYVTKKGVLANHDDRECECEFCGYLESKKNARVIKAVWGESGCEYAWLYATLIPHSSFEILEDGEKYCRGIVFEVSDI